MTTLPSISINELKKYLNEDLILLDVREKSAFQAGHIQGAINQPLEEINVSSYEKGQRVYVICQAGVKSRQATQILRNHGIDAVNVTEGMKQWMDETVSD